MIAATSSPHKACRWACPFEDGFTENTDVARTISTACANGRYNGCHRANYSDISIPQVLPLLLYFGFQRLSLKAGFPEETSLNRATSTACANRISNGQNQDEWCDIAAPLGPPLFLSFRGQRPSPRVGVPEETTLFCIISTSRANRR